MRRKLMVFVFVWAATISRAFPDYAAGLIGLALGCYFLQMFWANP